jgi:hypothetical protein
MIAPTIYEIFKGQDGAFVRKRPRTGNHGEGTEAWRGQDASGALPFS